MTDPRSKLTLFKQIKIGYQTGTIHNNFTIETGLAEEPH